MSNPLRDLESAVRLVETAPDEPSHFLRPPTRDEREAALRELAPDTYTAEDF